MPIDREIVLVARKLQSTTINIHAIQSREYLGGMNY